MTKINSAMFGKMLFASSVFLLGACGDNLPQTGPGGLTPDDAAALDAAAEKLDGQASPPPPAPAPMATPAQEPARNSAPTKDK